MTASISTESDTSSVPFPSAADMVDDEPANIGMASSESSASNQVSNKTATSELTSSDKLSALPPSGSMSPNLNRILRSPGMGQTRTFRRSLDTSVSLPGDLEAGSPYHTWNSRHAANFPRATVSDGSIGNETPKRASHESERLSLPTIQSVRQAFSRRSRGGSDSAPPSPVIRSPAAMEKDTLDTPSVSRSRATSPLRMFQQWSAGLRSHHANEDPFVPIDPFHLKQLHFPRLPCFPSAPTTQQHDIEINVLPSSTSHDFHDTQCTTSLIQYTNNFSTFMTTTLPSLIYLHMLLRLPSLYFARVARVFEDAEVSKPDIQRMIDAASRGVVFDNNLNITGRMDNAPVIPGTTVAPPQPLPLPFPEDWTPPLVSPALVRFKLSWEAFIDSLLREWKTLNVVSALLLSAILTIFQIPGAATDPLTRTTALLSLVCALMSLSYGCIYIVRFGTMRSMYRASRWAEEARKTNTFIWWNVWVLLAMPAVWMSWSMVYFIISILSFVWRTGSVNDPEQRAPMSASAALVARIAITLLLCSGLACFVMIVKTLKRYGTQGNPFPRTPLRTGGILNSGAIGGEQPERGRKRDRKGAPQRNDSIPLASSDGGDNINGDTSNVIGLGLIGIAVKGQTADVKDVTEDNEKIEVAIEMGEHT